MTQRNWIVVGMVQVLLAWLALPVQAADRMKVAMMDQQQVIERSVAGKRALEDLKSYSTTRQKIIDSDDQELKELEKTKPRMVLMPPTKNRSVKGMGRPPIPSV